MHASKSSAAHRNVSYKAGESLPCSRITHHYDVVIHISCAQCQSPGPSFLNSLSTVIEKLQVQGFLLLESFCPTNFGRD